MLPGFSSRNIIWRRRRETENCPCLVACFSPCRLHSPISGAKFQCIYKSTRKTRIFSKKMKKLLAIPKEISYTNNCCDMIAMKREVAARVAGFPWSECQVRKLTTSHCTETEDHEMVENNVCEIEWYTRESVQSPLVVLIKSAKRRRLFLWQVK